MKKQVICVIGTDTEVGKTYTCCKVMSFLASFNQPAATIKPIASGVIQTNELGIINEDVYQLFKTNSHLLSISQINQFCFARGVAPHIAAKLENITLSVKEITAKVNPIIQAVNPSSHILIEGVGGLMVPLNIIETYIDLLKIWNYPIILVVGMKLGCLNHALLTVSVLKHFNLPFIGWIANQIDPQMECYQDNLNFLMNKLIMPCLGTITYNGYLQPTESFRRIFLCP